MVFLLALAAGLAAGFVNTLAGSGSLLTLPALLALGLPATIANGTNRVGILTGAIVSVLTFLREGQYAPRPRADGVAQRMRIGRWIVVTLIGALAGASVVVGLDPATLDRAIGVLFLAMLAVLVLRPQQWIRSLPGTRPSRDPETSPEGSADPVLPVSPGGAGAAAVSRRSPSPWLTAPVFLVVGFYGGFLQAGVGVLLLLALVGAAKLDWVRANAAKNLVIVVFTVPVLVIFAAHGQVAWPIGLLVSAGQGTGAFVAARFASRHAGAEKWIRRLLAAVVAITAAKLLGLGTVLASAGG